MTNKEHQAAADRLSTQLQETGEASGTNLGILVSAAYQIGCLEFLVEIELKSSGSCIYTLTV
jgi:hypothetical protein